MNRRRVLRLGGATLLSTLTTGCLDSFRTNPGERASPTEAANVRKIPEYTATHHSIAPDVRELERLTHEATNAARREHSRSPLSYDSELADIARLHSRDMAVRDFYAHENPDGETHISRLRKYGYYSRVVYENLVSIENPVTNLSVEELAQMAVDSWLGSPRHREALLREHNTEEGIGVYVTAEPRIYWTAELSKYDVDRQTPTQ